VTKFGGWTKKGGKEANGRTELTYIRKKKGRGTREKLYGGGEKKGASGGHPKGAGESGGNFKEKT